MPGDDVQISPLTPLTWKWGMFLITPNQGWEFCSPLLFVVQFPRSVWLFVTPWTAAHQASLSFTISQSLLKLMSIESVIPSNHLILCCPLLLLPSIFPSIRIFSWWKVDSAWGGQSIVASALASVLSMNIQGWFPLKIDWFDLPAVQRTLKSLLKHQASTNASLVEEIVSDYRSSSGLHWYHAEWLL